jgi:hypothetical protein
MAPTTGPQGGYPQGCAEVVLWVVLIVVVLVACLIASGAAGAWLNSLFGR